MPDPRGQRMNVVPLRGPRATPEKDPGKATKQQLDRVLSSTTFRQVDRLKRFLSFIVAESLAGRGDQLKEYVIGVQVFDKDASFDPRADRSCVCRHGGCGHDWSGITTKKAAPTAS